MIATRRDSIELVRLLLEYGAEPNVHDQYGCTALAIAKKKSATEIVADLVKSGAQEQ